MSNQNDQLATNLVNQLLYYATQLSTHHSKRDKQAILLGQDVILQRFKDTFAPSEN